MAIKTFFLSFFAHLGVLLPTGHIIILMYSVFHIIGPPRLFQNKRGHIHDSPPTFFHVFVCFIWVLRMSTWTLILGAPMVNNMEYTVHMRTFKRNHIEISLSPSSGV